MFCKKCFISIAPVTATCQGVALPMCPKCDKPMEDTCYTQWCESKETLHYDVDAAGNIFCIENGETLAQPKPKHFHAEAAAMKSREDWQAKKEREENKETAAINAYLAPLANGNPPSRPGYFNTFK